MQNKAMLPLLPPKFEVETPAILKKCILGARHLAELNGFLHAIPNPRILLETLNLQEAKDSSGIENIISTHEELYLAEINAHANISPHTKEIENYKHAIMQGFAGVQARKMLTFNDICAVQAIIENNNAGIRRQAGTVLRNAATNEIIYTPPQNYQTISDLLANLEKIINDDTAWAGVDPLIKMAVIHYQFESIHPFFDGNGRTGRIVNVLYLVLRGLLDAPILYLSRYIIKHKEMYYRTLQRVRTHNEWENMILFMLDAIINTAIATKNTVVAIDQAMTAYREKISTLKNIKAGNLLDTLFLFPYTRIAHLQAQLGISRITATNYLEQLTNAGLLEKFSRGRNHYFANKALWKIITAIEEA